MTVGKALTRSASLSKAQDTVGLVLQYSYLPPSKGRRQFPYSICVSWRLSLQCGDLILFRGFGVFFSLKRKEGERRDEWGREGKGGGVKGENRKGKEMEKAGVCLFVGWLVA